MLIDFLHFNTPNWFQNLRSGSLVSQNIWLIWPGILTGSNSLISGIFSLENQLSIILSYGWGKFVSCKPVIELNLPEFMGLDSLNFTKLHLVFLFKKVHSNICAPQIFLLCQLRRLLLQFFWGFDCVGLWFLLIELITAILEKLVVRILWFWRDFALLAFDIFKSLIYLNDIIKFTLILIDLFSV